MKQVRFVVKEAFRDLEDENRVYQPGENYPVKGAAVPERVRELSTNDNKQGKPLIRVVEEEVDYTVIGIDEPKTQQGQTDQQQKQQEKTESEPPKKEAETKKTAAKKVAETDEGGAD